MGALDCDSERSFTSERPWTFLSPWTGTYQSTRPLRGANSGIGLHKKKKGGT
jgi:hypothetical protein